MPADPIDTRAPARVTLSGRTLTAFGGCDYLALSRAPAVLDAVREGLDRYGLSVTASRETTGNTEAHEQLERAVRVFFDPVLPGHDVLLCPDGYIANLAAAQSLRARGVRRAWLDAHAHKSLEDAAHAAGLPISRYPHQETPSFVDAATIEPAVVMTDGVFSAHGAQAPIQRLADAMPSNATLLIDDCHGVAAMGEGGRGVLTRAQIDPARVVLTTTLAKGVGAAGGVVVAPTDLIECARRHASAYVCTTPIAPALAMGAVAAIHAIDHEPWRLRRLQKLVHRLDEHCERLALTTPARRGAPIAAFTLGSGATMRRLHEELIAEQWLVPLIEYPNGPSERYFRLSVNADHTLDDLDQLFETIDAARRDASKE